MAFISALLFILNKTHTLQVFLSPSDTDLQVWIEAQIIFNVFLLLFTNK